MKNAHPHRFRHTFAAEYLRNGGQMVALKDLLGHSGFEMVEHYAHFVQADIRRDHQSASPVETWKLLCTLHGSGYTIKLARCSLALLLPVFRQRLAA